MLEKDRQLELSVLRLVQTDSNITQRKIATELGIALGLANTYLRRCVMKGLVKMTSAPAKRYAYYLTPQGLAEKGHLVGEFLSQSFNFFRQAREQCEAALARCADTGWRRVALCGEGDFAAIARLCAPEFGVDILGTVAGSHDPAELAAALAGLAPVDAVLLTELARPQAVFDVLIQVVAQDRVLTPKFMEVVRP